MRRIGERTANETLKPEVVASFEDRDVRSVWWVNDQRLLLELEVELTGPGRADRGPGLFAVDADGGSYRPLIETAHAFRRGAPLSVPLLG